MRLAWENSQDRQHDVKTIIPFLWKGFAHCGILCIHGVIVLFSPNFDNFYVILGWWNTTMPSKYIGTQGIHLGHLFLNLNYYYYIILRQTLTYIGLTLNSLCSQGWSWILNSPAFTSQVPGFQACGIMPDLNLVIMCVRACSCVCAGVGDQVWQVYT